jgi:hypothetical protein
VRAPRADLPPQVHEGGVYVVCGAWSEGLDVRLGLEASAVLEGADAAAHTEVVAVILDGSAGMDRHWEPESATGICRVSHVLFKIAERIKRPDQELWLGFLGHGELYPLPASEPGAALEQRLQRIRARHKLRFRGPFFRPVAETSVRRFADRQQRLYVLSDSFLPDFQDVDLQVSASVVLRLTPKPTAADPEPALFPKDGKDGLDTELLDRHFTRDRGILESVELGFGGELPVEWEPACGELARKGEEVVLRWAPPASDALRLHVRVRMAHQLPPMVRFQGTVRRPAGPFEFRFEELPRAGSFEPLDTVQRGRLGEDELALWQRICRADGPCPDCGQTEVHLLHRRGLAIRPRPIFASLDGLNGGWLALGAERPDWCFFQTGCRIDGAVFVVLDDELCCSRNREDLERVRPGPADLRLSTHGTGRLYLCRV